MWFRSLLSSLYQHRAKAMLALAGALASATCFGFGIGMLLPAVQLLLRERKSLPEILGAAVGSSAAAEGTFSDLVRTVASHLPAGPVPSFLLVMAVISFLAVAGGLFEFVQQRAANFVVSSCARQWRSRLFRQFLRLTTERSLQEGQSANLSRLVTDVGVVSRAFHAILGKPVLESFKGVAGLTVAFALEWRLTLAALASAPLIVFPLRHFARATHSATVNALSAQGRVVGVLQQALLSLPVIKVYAAQEYEEHRFEAVNQGLFEEESRVSQANAAASSIIETLSVLVVTAVTAGAAWYMFRHSLDPAGFITVLIALFAAAQGLRPLNRIVQSLAEACAAIDRLVPVLEAPVEDCSVSAGARLPILPLHRRAIVFEAVRYVYPGRTRPALDGVSLEIEHGQIVALTGANGSGKTTLLSLIPRLIDPVSGRVLIDGEDVRAVSLWHLRQQIALVSQDTMLFGGTIAQNIAYGLPDVSRERIERAAELAQVDELVMTLPGGYDCVLGELGTGLSSGQRQRLAIARAVLRDPAILILDEATSQIDSDSTARIHSALRRIRKGRTILIVALDVSDVPDADIVVAMEQGQVVRVTAAVSVSHG